MYANKIESINLTVYDEPEYSPLKPKKDKKLGKQKK